MAKETKQKQLNNKNKSNANQYFNLDEEKAFFDEVDEEVRNERFKKLINKYGVWILSILVLALSFTVGYERIAEWKISKSEQKNIQYVKALTPSKDYNDNIIELENIVKTETGIYRDVAYLQIANIFIDNNQIDKALEVLENICKDEKISDKVKEIALIKIATYKVDVVDYAEMENLLSPIIAKNGAWSNVAKDLLAMSAIKNNNNEKAKAIYQELLVNENISIDMRNRINDMLAFINEDK